MYPNDHCRPITHLIDRFDGAIPWHCYKAVKIVDTGGNAEGGFYQVDPVRSPAWFSSAGKLTLPDYVRTINNLTLGYSLGVKVKTPSLPFTFQSAFKYTDIAFSNPAYNIEVRANGFLPELYVGVNGQYQVVIYRTGSAAPGDRQTFTNLAAIGDEIYLKFVIEANRSCYYDFTINA
jgi:hypothetical protein